MNGAGRGTRTPDPLITNQVLYQLSYAGDQGAAYSEAERAGKHASLSISARSEKAVNQPGEQIGRQLIAKMNQRQLQLLLFPDVGEQLRCR